MGRNSDDTWCYRRRDRVADEARRRPLYGLDPCLGWSVHPFALVRCPIFPSKLVVDGSRSLAYQFITELPLSNTLLPIVLPTMYLWIVDTLALKRGTWVIESGTKLGWQVWDGLEIEEAVFFLVTNILIVFGLVAFDNAYTILQTFPNLFISMPELPSPLLLIQALIVPTSVYSDDRIEGLQQALSRLRAKSRSFYLASGVFQGRLRIDLILLYSFCRVADDLVDEVDSVETAKHWLTNLNEYLDICYGKHSKIKSQYVNDYISSKFPPSAQATLEMLPTSCLSPQPLYDLLKGFEMDLHFSSSQDPFPIKDEPTLEIYGSRVAGTVAEACLELVFHHTKRIVPEMQKKRIVHAGGQMGIALQYINIARDVSVDAANRRVYFPTAWLNEKDISPNDIIKDPTSTKAETLRQHLLDKAFEIYDKAKGAIEELPLEARGPMRVAVESYVEIGRVLRTPGYQLKAGRATVPKLRRLRVAWHALSK